MAKIYVGNLTYELEPRDLEDEFSRFGKVEQCAVKRGFAFVHFVDAKDAEVRLNMHSSRNKTAFADAAVRVINPLQAAVQAMDNQEWKGRRMKVAFATSTGEGGGDRRVPRSGGGGGGGGFGGGDQRDGGDAPVSQNLFVANIPPQVKMRELEEFFEQFGKVENVKILPQARGNLAMSAFVDFAEVADATRAFEAELVLDGQVLRSDYNIRRTERREFSDRGDRRDSRGGGGDYDRQGPFADDRRAYFSRSGDFDNYRGGGSGRRDRSRSPARRDRSRDRRGSGGSGGGDDRYQRRDHRSDRSPPRSGGGNGGGRDRDFGRDGQYQQQRERQQPRSPPRGNGHAIDLHARMNGNDGSYASGSRGGGERNSNITAQGEWHSQGVRGAGADRAALEREIDADAARYRLLATMAAGASYTLRHSHCVVTRAGWVLELAVSQCVMSRRACMQQGVVVSCDGDAAECVIDDGTGVAVVDMRVFLKNTPPGMGKRPSKGEYVMVIGPLQKKLMQHQTGDDASSSSPLRILAHQVVHLDAKEQRESVWFLEVIEYWTSVVAHAS